MVISLSIEKNTNLLARIVCGGRRGGVGMSCVGVGAG